jgi:hypothetical protein
MVRRRYGGSCGETLLAGGVFVVEDRDDAGEDFALSWHGARFEHSDHADRAGRPLGEILLS